MTSIDWRLAENRREAFLRYFLFEIDTKGQTGNVYSFLPAIAAERDLSPDELIWLAWLDANSENPISSVLLLDASADGEDPEGALRLWRERYEDLSWDRDRRYQKRDFGSASEAFLASPAAAAETWEATAVIDGWEGVWKLARSLPSMGRLSAWYLYEVVRILLGAEKIPDMGSLLLRDKSGSRSHRNGLAYVLGHDSAPGWKAGDADLLGLVPDLEALGEDLLAEARERSDDPWISRLTLETALCAFKGWATRRRRYPNVYVDEFYYKIRDAEKVWGDRFGVLWEARKRDLPEWLRLEDTPNDPGIVEEKSLHFQRTGQPVNLSRIYRDMPSDFDDRVDLGLFGRRVDS